MTPAGFELARFERLPATATTSLVRIAGRLRAEEGERLTPVALAAHHPGGSLRFAPLPDSGRGFKEPDGAGGRWRAAFSVPVALSHASGAYTLHVGASAFELPSPLERPLIHSSVGAGARAAAEGTGASETRAAELESNRQRVATSELAEARAVAEAERELRAVVEQELEAVAESERTAQEGLERQRDELERAWAALERQTSELAELQTRIAEARQTLAEVIGQEELERAERIRLEAELHVRLEGRMPEPQPPGQREELERLRFEALRGADQAADLERRIAELGLALAEPAGLRVAEAAPRGSDPDTG